MSKPLVCPKCASTDGPRLSHFRVADALLRLFGLRAYRCRDCRKRFYSWRRLTPDSAA